MSWEENVHVLMHVTQVIITLFIVYRFVQNYREIKSNFNLGLIVFSIAMLMQIIISWSMNIFVHMVAEIFELIALLIFIDIIQK